MIVVDSGVVVDALAAAEGTERLRAIVAAEDLHAPALLDVEVVSIVRGLTLGSRISSARGVDLLNDFDDLTIHRWPFAGPLRRRALQLRDNVTAYDAAYLTLAEALGCPLLTRDSRLGRATGHDARVEVC